MAMSSNTAGTECLADDLLHGGDAIAVFIWGDANKRRRVYHLAETAQLPVFRMGATLCARKSRLLAWIERQEMR
jgi:hypothetical protein